MSSRFQSQDATGVFETLPGYGKLYGWKRGTPTASEPGWAPGAIVIDVTNGLVYQNTGTVLAATWSVGVSTGATFATMTITTLTSTTINATTINPTNIVRTAQTYKVGAGRAKAGTTAGWTVGAGNNLGTIATVAQSQSASTLVVPIGGLHVGDTITGFGVYASINSGGNTATLDCDLRKIVIAAGATGTDSSIGTLTQVSVATATASGTTKGSLTEVVVAGTGYYFLLAATTAASTTIELTGLEVTVTSA